jgi:succinylarginine dihydrolase
MIDSPAGKIVQEVVFVGLPGITHHYGGLSADNVASGLNQGSESSPAQAALQAIMLMRHLKSLGVIVGMLPPQLRPHLPLLQEDGFNVDDAPSRKLEQASSSSFMWAANAATVSPVCDSGDHNLHITTANLYTNPHRRIEAQATNNVLRQLFKNVPQATLHPPLNAGEGFRDEGAANHMRLTPSHDMPGLNVFVYGGRQNIEASKEIAANHLLSGSQTLFLRQNPEVIAKGVFHNDVIAVSNENLLLVHERAYAGGMADIERIRTAYSTMYPEKPLQLIIVKESELSVEESVHSYFFNSQIVTKANGKMAVIAPMELESLYDAKALRLLERICADRKNTIDEFELLDLRQSMKNGGGPACLRLRIQMTIEQVGALSQHTGALMDEDRLSRLEKLVGLYYPGKLMPEDLRKLKLYENGRKLLAELGEMMKIAL